MDAFDLNLPAVITDLGIITGMVLFVLLALVGLMVRRP
jgi:hypothetical protein